MSKIETSAKSLLGIINDILDFSKVEAGKLEMESIPFDLDAVLYNIASMVSLKAAEKNLELIYAISEDVPKSLVGDPLRLGQILTNLANNAVKFTREGHIFINTTLVSEDDESIRLKFSVKDTGIGISKEHMDKLFKAFTQADTSMTRKFGGTGLGLSISNRLVELMDGELTVISEAGEGSDFTLQLRFLSKMLKKKLYKRLKIYMGNVYL